MITASGVLHIGPRNSNNIAQAAAILMAHLPQLNRTTSRHPPIKQLKLNEFTLQPSSTQCLLHAAAVHTAITSLSLCMPDEESTTLSILETLLPALPTALRLQHLDLCKYPPYAHSIGPQALQYIADALPALSSLRTLAVHSDGEVGDGTDDLWWPDREWSRTYAAFLSAVAAHTSLTALEIKVGPTPAPLPWPAEFPRLRNLSVAITSARCKHDSLSRARVAAAFPSLPALTHLSFAFVIFMRKEPCAHLLPLSPGAGRCPGLRSLAVKMRKVPFISMEDQEFVWQEFRGTATPQAHRYKAACRCQETPHRATM